MNNRPIDIVLSGPRTHEGIALVMSAYNIRPMLGDVVDLAQCLAEAEPKGWRSYDFYGLLFVEGQPDLDVTPYLLPVCEWLAYQRFDFRVVVLDAAPDRLEQIRSVFPKARPRLWR